MRIARPVISLLAKDWRQKCCTTTRCNAGTIQLFSLIHGSTNNSCTLKICPIRYRPSTSRHCSAPFCLIRDRNYLSQGRLRGRLRHYSYCTAPLPQSLLLQLLQADILLLSSQVSTQPNQSSECIHQSLSERGKFCCDFRESEIWKIFHFTVSC